MLLLRIGQTDPMNIPKTHLQQEFPNFLMLHPFNISSLYSVDPIHKFIFVDMS